MAQALGDLPRRFVPHLMTRPTAIRFQQVQPLTLALHILRNAVAFRPCAGELALIRHAQQRKPIHGRIVFRRCLRVRCHHRSQVDYLSWSCLHRRGIHQPVTAHPQFVVRLGKLREHVTSAVIGDHDLDKFGGQVSRFCDHPYASLQPFRAGDHPADIVVTDGDRFPVGLLRLQPTERRYQDHTGGDQLQWIRDSLAHDVSPPSGTNGDDNIRNHELGICQSEKWNTIEIVSTPNGVVN